MKVIATFLIKLIAAFFIMLFSPLIWLAMTAFEIARAIISPAVSILIMMFDKDRERKFYR